MKPISVFLALALFLSNVNLPAFFSQVSQGSSACGQQIFLPIIASANTMANQSITEQLEDIVRKDAAFPYDGRITQIFTNTVNVKPIGSRTIIRDVALPAHIKAEDIGIGWAVRLEQTTGKPTIIAVYEQFADEEMFNYAGVGSRVPATPTVTVKATKSGWVVSWNAIAGATKYILYKNDDPNGDSPEEVAQVGGNILTRTVGFDSPFIWFAVRACAGYLEGDVSNWKTDQTPPANPVWATHNYQTNGHYVTWTHSDVNDVKEFIVYRNTAASNTNAVEVLRTTNKFCLLDYTSEGDYFGVQAVDYSGINLSPVVWTSQAYDPTPAVPSGVTANLAELGGFIVKWADAGSNILRYEVEGAIDNSGTNAAIKWSGQALVTPILAESGVVWFRVRTVGYNGGVSAWTAWATDTNPPPQPTIQVVNGLGNIVLSIAPTDTSHTSVGFSHYQVEVADDTNGTNTTVVSSHAPYANFPMVISQTEKTGKYYRVIPYDLAGNGGSASQWWYGFSRALDESPTIQDKFDGYGGSASTPLESLYWLQVASFDDSEAWNDPLGFGVSSLFSTTYVKEGKNSLKVNHSAGSGGSGIPFLAKTLNLNQEGRFTNDDYMLMSFYIEGTASNILSVSFDFKTSGSNYYRMTLNSGFVSGWNRFRAKRSSFTVVGSPNWSSITQISLSYQANPNFNTPVHFDDLRLVKADPDDATNENDTGPAWDRAVSSGSDIGEWHIYPGNRTGEPKKPFSYGQIKHSTSPTVWYLSHKALDTKIVTGTIQAGIMHRENGKTGLAFFIKNVTPGQWTMYAVEADNVADTISLVKWVNGTRTVLGTGSVSGFISGSTAQVLWLGVDFSQYDTSAGRLKVYASFSEGNLIQAVNLKISLQDTTIGSSGTVGLLSNQTNCRFVNLVAGSPAHAEVADVGLALDGPILAGETRRVHYNLDMNRFEYTDDGSAFAGVDAHTTDGYHASAGNTASTLAARDGAGDVTARLFRPEYNGAAPSFNYINVQNVRGTGDNYIRAASLAEFKDRLDLPARGCTVYRSGDYTGTRSAWTAAIFNAQSVAQQSGGPYWDGSTAIYTVRTGWHVVSICVGVLPNDWPDFLICIGVNGGVNAVYGGQRVQTSSNADIVLTVSRALYVAAGTYFQAFYLKNTGGSNPTIRASWTSMNVVELVA